MEKLILASASPRRVELLNQMGLEFTVRPQHVDESFTDGSPAEEAVGIALKKVQAFVSNKECMDTDWILGADTFVTIGNDFLGKPSDRDDARTMLKKMSGKTHQVITGLVLRVPGIGFRTKTCSTAVTFENMSPDEIEWYLDQDEWQGVAAAYRVQQKGALFISSIAGSYSNVMGLPINTFYGMLSADNFNFRS